MEIIDKWKNKGMNGKERETNQHAIFGIELNKYLI